MFIKGNVIVKIIYNEFFYVYYLVILYYVILEIIICI